MKMFREYIEAWIDGRNIRGINVTLCDIQECIYVYNAISRKEKPEFINGKVKIVVITFIKQEVKFINGFSYIWLTNRQKW